MPRTCPAIQDLGIVLAHGFTLNWQRPAVWRVATRLNKFGGVVTFDFRGHGRSGGVSTVGDKEIKDVEVAVGYARELGYQRIATVGFSMGGSIVLRHARPDRGVDAVVSVSSPGQWYYRGTRPMRLVHLAVENRTGRLITKAMLKTRISSGRWDPVPLPPADAAGADRADPAADRARRQGRVTSRSITRSGSSTRPRSRRSSGSIPGFGHAESGAGPQLIKRIGTWIQDAVGFEDAA